MRGIVAGGGVLGLLIVVVSIARMTVHQVGDDSAGAMRTKIESENRLFTHELEAKIRLFRGTNGRHPGSLDELGDVRGPAEGHVWEYDARTGEVRAVPE